MSLQRNEVLSIATQAAEWLRVMRSTDLRDDAAFVKWLKRSPLHVREFLLAYRLDQKLTHLDAEHRIDIEASGCWTVFERFTDQCTIWPAGLSRPAFAARTLDCRRCGLCCGSCPYSGAPATRARF